MLLNSEDVELVAGGLPDTEGASTLGDGEMLGDGMTTGAAVVPAAGGVSSGADGAMPEAAGVDGAAASEVGMGS